MRRNGWISKRSSHEWDIAIKDGEEVGRLGADSELYEPLAQAANLILSGEDNGPLQGSDKKFNVRKDKKSGARSLAFNAIGWTWFLREEQDKSRPFQITFSVESDFIFSSSADDRMGR